MSGYLLYSFEWCLSFNTLMNVWYFISKLTKSRRNAKFRYAWSHFGCSDLNEKPLGQGMVRRKVFPSLRVTRCRCLCPHVNRFDPSVRYMAWKTVPLVQRFF